MAKIATQSQKKTASESKPLTASQRREVERLAYQFFVERGQQHGSDQEDWARAESIVRSRRN